jgi:ribosomal protein L37E
MPYLRCPRCGLVTYTVAWHVGRDECPRCDEPLTRQPRRARPPNDAPRAASAPAEPQPGTPRA